ncbi:MAG TPA: hypothetical protein VFJ85_10880 [Acidimicrobiales bacterium]|nr:hypothetical protein [Acidimicrobiales bacterium]
MNLHPEATTQLAADRRAALGRAAAQARLAAETRQLPARSGLVARLAGWLHPDALPVPLAATRPVGPAPVIDLTDPVRLHVVRRPVRERAGSREVEGAGRAS